MKAIAVGFVVGGVAWVLVSLAWDLVRHWVDLLGDTEDLAEQADELADAYRALAERAYWQDQAQGLAYEAGVLDAQVRVLKQKLDESERLLAVVDPEVSDG